MVFDPFGINVFHGNETIEGKRIHRRRRRLRNRNSGCDEFDVPETSYPLKAKSGQPRIPA
jgi:hypothetical protein